MRTYVATGNLGKLAELRALFAGSELELTTFHEYRAVEEGEASYAGNAMLKARGLRSQLMGEGIEACVLADDSGLEVDALGGRPGVLSARYAGVDASWPERRRRLLSELTNVSEDRRGARFVSHVAFVREDGRSLEASGTVRGSITRAESGAKGFGYDPVFFYEPAGCTFAELSEAQKNAVSHRYHAARNLLERLRTGA